MSNKLKKPITRILLTHAHEDHIGALDALKELLPDATIYVSERDSRLMAGDFTLDKDEPDTPIRGGVPKNLKSRADVLLKDGDQIGSLVAVSSPGHTPGSFSYLDTRNNSLIVGDAYQTRGGFAVGGQMKALFPFPALATWNQEIALASAKKLRNCNPTLLATGHGKMIKEPQAIMDIAIIKAEQNIINSMKKRT
jgi:glyoxylase-like metal-dependent hydrolase (beta-lactamase superfamily II)